MTGAWVSVTGPIDWRQPVARGASEPQIAANRVVGAQIAANRVGERRLREIVAAHGAPTVAAYAAAVQDHTERVLLKLGASTRARVGAILRGQVDGRPGALTGRGES